MKDFHVGQTVRVPSINGTITKLVSYGKIESILPTINGKKIIYVKLEYGRFCKTLPFKEDELDTKDRIRR